MYKSFVGNMGWFKSWKDPLLAAAGTATNLEVPVEPTLAEDSMDMLNVASLMYAFADLRLLARQGKLDDASRSRALDLPVSSADVLHLLHHCQPQLMAAFGGDEEGINSYIGAVQQIEKKLQAARPHDTEVAASSRVVCFDDERSQHELVYGIAVNVAQQRITIGFRGSVTTRDFTTDANSIVKVVPSPSEGSNDWIGIHLGFYDYMFGKTKKTGPNKFESVMTDLLKVLDQYPGYRVYTTGHSLGGALCTLFAAFVAASTDCRIVKPIICVSIASPKVGNVAFRRCFQDLEARAQIRCLRIANRADVVTLLPDRGTFSCLYVMCCQAHVYRHVGVGLKLNRSVGHKLTYTPPQSYGSLLVRDVGRLLKNMVFVLLTLPAVCFCGRRFLAWHSCNEYAARLQREVKALQEDTLAAVYERKVLPS